MYTFIGYIYIYGALCLVPLQPVRGWGQYHKNGLRVVPQPSQVRRDLEALGHLATDAAELRCTAAECPGGAGLLYSKGLGPGMLSRNLKELNSSSHNPKIT